MILSTCIPNPSLLPIVTSRYLTLLDQGMGKPLIVNRGRLRVFFRVNMTAMVFVVLIFSLHLVNQS